MESMKFVGEKLREAFLAPVNLGGEALAWFNGVIPPETRSEKLKQARLAAESSGAAGLAWIDKAIPPETRSEKIKQLRLAGENASAVGLAWIDKAFPPENRAENIQHCLRIAKPYLAPGAALLVLLLLIRGGAGAGLGKMVRALIRCIFRVGREVWNMMTALIRGFGKIVRALIRFIFRGSVGSGKTMKAPGRNCRILRAGFESNPKGYFRDLRKGKSVISSGACFGCAFCISSCTLLYVFSTVKKQNS